MRLVGEVKHSRAGEKLNIVVVEAEEQARRIHEAVKRRAFEIFEKRGTGSHEQEDWRQAESALLRPICIGRMAVDDSFWVSADATNFQEGTINIWVAARRLTICGMPRPKQQASALSPSSSVRQEEVMFRQVTLPIEIDPFSVTACINGKFLEIRLKKAPAKPAQATRAAAA
ncbi:MAG TPA: Hsp20 family protein [Candidatus Acidoferrum sp.]|nr:Hsp20 family protein [Candidatus Acidoferrum sp.]